MMTDIQVCSHREGGVTISYWKFQKDGVVKYGRTEFRIPHSLFKFSIPLSELTTIYHIFFDAMFDWAMPTIKAARLHLRMQFNSPLSLSIIKTSGQDAGRFAGLKPFASFMNIRLFGSVKQLSRLDHLREEVLANDHVETVCSVDEDPFFFCNRVFTNVEEKNGEEDHIYLCLSHHALQRFVQRKHVKREEAWHKFVETLSQGLETLEKSEKQRRQREKRFKSDSKRFKTKSQSPAWIVVGNDKHRTVKTVLTNEG